MPEFSADELSDFTRMKRLREVGYFESEGSVPMPEIVADGEEPALSDLRAARRTEVDFNQIEDHAAQQYFAQTTRFCFTCQRQMVHGCVAMNNKGYPVFHCNTCCACHLCLERLSRYDQHQRPMSLRGSRCPGCGLPQRLFIDDTCTLCNPPLAGEHPETVRKSMIWQQWVREMGVTPQDNEDESYA